MKGAVACGVYPGSLDATGAAYQVFVINAWERISAMAKTKSRFENKMTDSCGLLYSGCERRGLREKDQSLRTRAPHLEASTNTPNRQNQTPPRPNPSFLNFPPRTAASKPTLQNDTTNNRINTSRNETRRDETRRAH